MLVLSMHDEPLFAGARTPCGGARHIMKRETIDGLVRAIQEVHAGRLSISQRMSQHLLERLTRMPISPGTIQAA